MKFQNLSILLILFYIFLLFNINLHAESIELYEIAEHIGVRPDNPTLLNISKGGSFSGKIINPESMRNAGFTFARIGLPITIQKMGDNNWKIDQIQTGEIVIVNINRAVYPNRNFGLNLKIISHYLP